MGNGMNAGQTNFGITLKSGGQRHLTVKVRFAHTCCGIQWCVWSVESSNPLGVAAT